MIGTEARFQEMKRETVVKHKFERKRIRKRHLKFLNHEHLIALHPLNGCYIYCSRIFKLFNFIQKANIFNVCDQYIQSSVVIRSSEKNLKFKQ